MHLYLCKGDRLFEQVMLQCFFSDKIYHKTELTTPTQGLYEYHNSLGQIENDDLLPPAQSNTDFTINEVLSDLLRVETDRHLQIFSEARGKGSMIE